MKAKTTLCLAECLLMACGARAGGFLYSGGAFSQVNYPGSTTTMPFAINDNHEIVGWYADSSGADHGFLKTGSTYSTIDYPGAVKPIGTILTGINNSRTMVGCYWDGSVLHGFLYNAGSFIPLDFPGAVESQPFGINNHGEVVGCYWDGINTHGFLYAGGTFNSFDVSPAFATQPYRINDNGQIVGGYFGNGDGFSFGGGVYTNLSFPDALCTAAYGINNLGQIVGSYSGLDPGSAGGLGFLYQEGKFLMVDYPSSAGTFAHGINNFGEIVGSFNRGPPAAPLVPFTHATNNGAIAITGYLGPLGYVGAVTIPDTINGLPVTSIGNEVFLNCTNVTSVMIPGSVTHIGDAAFAGCTGLKAVYFDGNAPGLGWSVFNLDSDAIVYYSAGATGWGATFGGLRAMLGTALVPAAYAVTNGTIAITHYTGSGGAVVIPETISGLPVTSIRDAAFSRRAGLTRVTIPESVTNIGSFAFAADSDLTSVTLGNGVASIGDQAFWLCTRLTSIMIPGSVTRIGDAAFSGCASLKGIYFIGNAPSAGLSVFNSDTNATVYYLPGTTGWGSTFAGLPALLWNARVQGGDGNVGVGMNGFGFKIIGTSNLVIVVEAARNLDNPEWSRMRTLTLTNGSTYFSDTAWTNYSRRYYRLSAP